MIEETRIFFRHLIEENLPVNRLIDAATLPLSIPTWADIMA